VNDSLGITGSMISTDFALKYSFYKQLGRGIVDPYIGAGIGATLRTSDKRNTAKTLSPTCNFTVGCTFWMSSKLGLQVQGTMKLGLTDLFKSSDYMQYSVGLTYRIPKTDGYKSDFDKSKYKISRHRTRIKVKKPKSES
jgi:outer membrane protein W